MNQSGGILRLAENHDEAMLKTLWKTVFKDSDADILYFFNAWFSPELTVVIDNGNQPVSAAYILPVGNLVMPDGARINCAMIYAVATKEGLRRCGYGELVTREAARIAVQKGFPAVVLKPGNDGLFEFYLKHTPFKEYFDIFETEFSPGALSLSESPYFISPIEPEEYRWLRVKLLRGCTYIDMDEKSLSYLQYLCASTGGGMYALSRDEKKVGCAAIEREQTSMSVKELLLDTGCQLADAVSAISAVFPADKYYVRSPYENHGANRSNLKRFGMMTTSPGRAEMSVTQGIRWYGPAFD